jgi:hypothetical protein
VAVATLFSRIREKLNLNIDWDNDCPGFCGFCGFRQSLLSNVNVVPRLSHGGFLKIIFKLSISHLSLYSLATGSVVKEFSRHLGYKVCIPGRWPMEQYAFISYPKHHFSVDVVNNKLDILEHNV